MASLSAGSSDRAAGPAGVSAVEVSSVTRGVALWLSRHWLDKARRKLARAGVLREGEGDTGDAGGLAVRLDIIVSPDNADGAAAVVLLGGHASGDSGGITEEQLDLARKHVAKAVRALAEEDLGDMDAAQLRPAIRDSKNGWKDLSALENKFKIVVCYCEAPSEVGAARGTYTNNHVRLVGAKKTLEKKCSDVRSILSHYHWRLSGRDVAFSDMVARG